MRSHPRIRKTIKWGGVVVAVALCVLALWSRTHAATWNSSPFYPNWRFAVARGSMTVACERTGYVGETLQYWPERPTGRYKALRMLWLPQWGISGRDSFVSVPLWMAAVLAGLPAITALRLAIMGACRARIGKCPTCSYPRTGLAPSSPCPECGAAAPSA